MMYRKSRIVDVIAGVGLLGMVALSAAAQVGPPVPSTHTCDGFTIYRFDGEPIVIEDWQCPEGQNCIQITIYDAFGRVIGAAGGCVDPQ